MCIMCTVSVKRHVDCTRFHSFPFFFFNSFFIICVVYKYICVYKYKYKYKKSYIIHIVSELVLKKLGVVRR